MDYADDHDSVIKGIFWFLQLLLVVEEEESEW